MTTATHSKLRVRFGQALLRPAGRTFLDLDLHDRATARELSERIGQEIPHLHLLIQLALVVAGGRILGPDEEVHRDDEITLLLPVAGG